MSAECPSGHSISRRQLFSRMAATDMDISAICSMAVQNLNSLNPLSVEKPLTGYPNRDWERVYRNLCKPDSTFRFLCARNLGGRLESPLDTGSCGCGTVFFGGPT